MNSEEYATAIQGVMNDLEQGAHANILVSIATTAMNIIKQRVQETGTNAQGGKFRAYSEWYKAYKQAQGKYKGFTDFSFTTRMWTNIQLIKSLSSDNTAVISTLDRGTLGSNITVAVKPYVKKEKLIEKNGKLEVKPERLMLKSQKRVYVPSNWEKLIKNSENFGPILELSSEEKTFLKKEYERGLVEIFVKNGLGIS